jgi:hypothetical protein
MWFGETSVVRSNQHGHTTELRQGVHLLWFGEMDLIRSSSDWLDEVSVES